MSSAENILALRLKGSLMSCGVPAIAENRPTGMFPSKGQVVGVVGSAMGVERTDRESIAALASLQMASFKIHAGPVITDFQVVMPNELKGCLIGAVNGIKSKDRKNLIRRKSYICDADYVVFLTGDSSFLEKCQESLILPAHPLFLGRACCVPSEPVLGGIFETDEEALDYLRRLTDGAQTKCLEYERDCSSDEADDQVKDVPVEFGDSAEYLRRFVQRGLCKLRG